MISTRQSDNAYVKHYESCRYKFCWIYAAEIKRIDFISEGADYYEREKAGCQEQMEKCCSSVSYVTGGSTGLNVKVSLSGLSKQDYIIQCLLKHEIRVVGGMKVAKKVQVHLDTMLEELQTLDESDRGIDVEELLVQLKHVLDILQSDEKGGNHYE